MMRKLLQFPAACAIGLVRLYQRGISPLLGKNCRFQPSCSQYMIEAIGKYGLLRGVFKGTYRIIRCNPWCRGGFDPP